MSTLCAISCSSENFPTGRSMPGLSSPPSSASTSATGSSTGIGMSSSTSSDIVVQAKHLGKAYQLYARRNDWLKQVMFGESIGILGRNGCGKSTLLQVICGMTLPSHGELRVTGRIAPVLALGSTFDLELSGRENVMIGGAVLGLKRSEVLRKFNSIAEFAGIGDYMDQPVKHYSMGMRTRLAFSICAHVEAEILVVDEALAVGDAAFQRKCLDWIDSFRKTGTLLFVSHSMAEVRRLCTRAIWIDDGCIREQGDPSEVIRN